jgi:hypothetical protein
LDNDEQLAKTPFNTVGSLFYTESPARQLLHGKNLSGQGEDVLLYRAQLLFLPGGGGLLPCRSDAALSSGSEA